MKADTTKLLQKDKRLLQRHPHYRINDNTQEYSKATFGWKWEHKEERVGQDKTNNKLSYVIVKCS